MQESGEDFGEQDEDTEIQNLPLYTERKADGIYRYRRRHQDGDGFRRIDLWQLVGLPWV